MSRQKSKLVPIHYLKQVISRHDTYADAARSLGYAGSTVSEAARTGECSEVVERVSRLWLLENPISKDEIKEKVPQEILRPQGEQDAMSAAVESTVTDMRNQEANTERLMLVSLRPDQITKFEKLMTFAGFQYVDMT